MTESDQARIVAADPTKEFFIYMLTRDIALPRAIIDLVDNAIDGALRLRGEDQFDGLQVDLQITPDRFRIADNCGGIPVEIARHYAFRFGRPAQAEPTKHSIGQFGVGMKRALFKLGSHFRVESRTDSSRFVIEHAVDQWKADPRWSFEFTELEEGVPQAPETEAGTIITVEPLHSTVADAFQRENFLTELRESLAEAHQESLARGMTITLNGIPLGYSPAELLHSDLLKPAYREREIQLAPNASPIRVRLYAGVADSNPQAAGWYVFCNGRLVLGPDQSEVTGWGAGGETVVPKYHNRSARFRGYVFFDSDDAAQLPWNTTKTGVDVDSPVYRAIRQEMITLMRPVIDFLNQLSREIESDPEETPLQDAVAATEKTTLAKLVAPANVFRAPTPAIVVSRGPREGVISYRRPLDAIRIVKESLGVTTQREVGEKTFDYYFQLECADS